MEIVRMKQLMNKKTAAIYIRVSTEEQVREGFSIQAQLGELQRYADQNNIVIVGKYIDEGTSGKNISGRPQMKLLLKDAQLEKFNLVMVYKIDRFARKLRDALDISDTLDKCNVKLISLKESFDTSTPHGTMTFQMFCMIAELERSTIVERGKLGQEQRAREGKSNGGVVLGYDSINKELVLNEIEATIVKKIFDYAEQDLGLKAITRRLNEMGYRTKLGNSFATFGVKTILKNPVYIGKIRYKQLENWSEKRRSGKNPNFILSEGIHQPIISLEQWDKVHSMIHKRSYQPIRSHTPYILSGLLKCPVCGHGMVPARANGESGQSYRYYLCGQFHNKGKSVCRSNMIRADYAEKQVFDELARIVSDPYILKKLVEQINHERLIAGNPMLEEKESIESAISKHQTKLKGLKGKVMNDPDLADMFKPELIELQADIANLQKSLELINLGLAEHDTKPVHYDSLKTLLFDFNTTITQTDPDDQKALLRMVVKNILITPEAPKRVGRKIKRINLHFDFTMNSLFSDAGKLLQSLKSYSEIIAPIDQITIDSMNNMTGEKLGDLMKSLSILPLAMIRFPPNNLKSPINLLHQNNPHQLMRVRNPPKRQQLVSTLHYRRRHPIGAADYKRNAAPPIHAKLIDLLSNLLR